jgi:hypothetical protein
LSQDFKLYEGTVTLFAAGLVPGTPRGTLHGIQVNAQSGEHASAKMTRNQRAELGAALLSVARLEITSGWPCEICRVVHEAELSCQDATLVSDLTAIGGGDRAKYLAAVLRSRKRWR